MLADPQHSFYLCGGTQMQLTDVCVLVFQLVCVWAVGGCEREFVYVRIEFRHFVSVCVVSV